METGAPARAGIPGTWTDLRIYREKADGEPSGARPPRRLVGVLRDLRFYWWGQTTSAFGSVFTAVAMPIVAIDHLGASAGEMGVISAAATLPAVALGLPVGAFADRIRHPRRVLLALDAISALAIAVLALGIADGLVTVAWLIGLSVLEGCLSILMGCLYFIHLRHLVDNDQIGPARARLQAGQYGAALLGRILAGPVIVAFGSPAALAIDAATYVLSASALLAMRSSDQVEPPPRLEGADGLRSAAAGLMFFVRQPFHRGLLVFILVPAAASSGLSALTGPFLLRVIRLPTAYYGLAFALSGLAGLAGSAIAARYVGRAGDPRRAVILAFTLSTACYLLLPLASGPLALATFVAALGIGTPIFFGAIANAALSSVMGIDVPEGEMGRVAAALQVVASLAAMLGSLLGGELGDRLGVRDALWTLCAVALAAAAIAAPQALRAARHMRAASQQTPVLVGADATD